MGTKTFLLFMLTTALATTLAITVAVIVDPGQGFDIHQIEESRLPLPLAPSWTQILIDLVPENPIAAYAEGNMLQIIFFTILFAICILMTGERGKPIAEFSEKMNEVMMQVVKVVMRVAPIGIGALVAKTFSEQGDNLLLPMLSYFFLVAVVLIVHAVSVLMILLSNYSPPSIFPAKAI